MVRKKNMMMAMIMMVLWTVWETGCHNYGVGAADDEDDDADDHGYGDDGRDDNDGHDDDDGYVEHARGGESGSDRSVEEGRGANQL